MQPQQAQISVWVCREEKLVLGLSRRTSCEDVVRALVEEHRGAAQAYCIVEKWRGFERILPSKTRIWRLWLAWGDEQSHVRFVLVKKEASLQSRAARSAEARVVLSRQSPGASGGPARGPGGSISPEKQRRVVRKAFRKLEKMNRRKAQAAHRDAERMETLAHLVISQDHTIRQQIHRISQLDAEIDRCEAEVHFERVQRLGVNYVQDTYLVDGASADQEEQEEQQEQQELVRRSEQVCALQEELRQQEALRDSLAAQVQDELNRRWMQRRSREEAAAPPCSGPEQELLQEAERVRTQLDASLYIGLRLNTDLEAIRSDLELTQEIYRAREEEMRDLLEKVNILELEEESCSRGTDDEKRMKSTLERKREWVEQARGLSKAHSGNDDDSDTGLSSLHSQDSDSQPVWESLV